MRRDRATDRAVIARIAALSLLLGAGIALGGEPKEWLERMNKALTSRNYVGVFTHMRGDRAETLRIIHRVKGKDVSERLFLVQKLRENDWNISRTADVIDTPRSNLYKKLEQYTISQETDG